MNDLGYVGILIGLVMIMISAGGICILLAIGS